MATNWTDFPSIASGAGSGSVSEENGAIIGASDFSEFLVASGLPTGITAFGAGAGDPSAVAIADDPEEGRYFEMTGQTAFDAWAFGLDSFDEQIEFGEMLARIYFNIPRNNRTNIGPVFSLRGVIENDLDWTGARPAQDINNFVRIQGSRSLGGVGSVPGPNEIISQAFQNQTWMWVRVRRLQGIGDPALDDWQVTAWYGDLGDEPGSVDGFSFDAIVSPRGILAMGWGTISVGSDSDQRIAFLSFTSDPSLAPPPTSIQAVVPNTVWTDIT